MKLKGEGGSMLRKKTISALVVLMALGSTLEIASANRLALKNFRELYAVLEYATGLRGTDDEFRNSFRLTRDRLPLRGDISELSSPMLLALTELSGVFCNRVVQNEKELDPGERILFNDVDFARGPIQFFGANRSALIQSLSWTFWFRAADDKEEKLISDMIDSAVENNLDNVEETVKLSTVLCTAYSSSLPFFLK